MSQTIENRIVEMQFENKQFESGVQESLSTLDKLKKSLNFDDSAKNLQSFSDSVTKNLDMNGIGSAVEKLKDRFSLSGIAGMEVIRRLTDFAIDAGKAIASALDAPFAQIRQGGWKRAMNIEDAKFQLKGLGIAWEAVSDDINYAVADTAYGLDEAAKACSQLSASSVQAGSDMKAALRGISGVAAMGNTGYTNIANIFTKAAGNGKVMADELNRISQYGLNARASLAKFFNDVLDGAEGTKDIPETVKKNIRSITEGVHVAESDISEFASKSKISFQTFSYAMDNAFGEHAKKANETFFGAFENIKAALNKIGAEFAEPIIKGAIPVFNQVRIFLNDLRKQMGPIFDTFARLADIFSDKLTKKIQNFRNALLGTDGNGAPMQNLIMAFNNIRTAVIRIVAAINTAFKEVFPNTKNISNSLKSITEGIANFTERLIMSDGTLIAFKNVLVIILSVLKNVGSVVKNILPLIGKAVNMLLSAALVIAKFIGYLVSLVMNLKFVKNIMNEIRESGGLVSFVIEKLKNAFVNLRDILTDTSTVTGKVFTTIKNAALNIVLIIGVSLYLAFVKIKEVLSYFDTHDPLGSLITGVKTLVDKLKELPVIRNIVIGIEAVFSTIGVAISKLITLVKDFITNLKSGMSVIKAVGVALSTVFGGAINLFGTLISKIKDTFSVFSKDRVIEESIEMPIYGANTAMNGMVHTLTKTKDGVKETTGAFNKAKTSVVSFGDTVLAKIRSIKVGQILLFAFGTAVTILALNIAKLTKSFSNLTDGLTNVTIGLKNFLNNFGKKRTSFSEGLLAISIAIGALTISLYSLSKISGPQLIQVTVALGSLLTIIGLFSVIGKNGAGPFSAAMMAFSSGILLLVGALYVIDKINMDNIWKKVGVLATIAAGMLVVSAILAKVSPSFSKGGLAIVSFAGSVYILAKALDIISRADLNNIRENWFQLSAVILAFAAFASIASNVGIAAALGLIGFVAVLKLLSANVDLIKNNFGNIQSAFRVVVEALKGAISYLYGGLKRIAEDIKKSETLGYVISGAVAAVIGSLIGIILALGKAGKGLKKAAVGFLLVGATIAGLMYATTKIAEMSQKINPEQLETARILLINIMTFLGILSGLSILSDDVNKNRKTNDTMLKDVRKLLTSMSLLLVSIGAFSAMVGSLSPDEFERVKTCLIQTEIVVGIIATVATAITALSSKAGKSEIGFSTFTGIVLLLGSLIGSIAVLLFMFSQVNWERDKQQLLTAAAAFGGIVLSILLILDGLSLIAKNSSNKGAGKAAATLLAFGALILSIAGIIYVFTKQMPSQDELIRAGIIAGAILFLIDAIVSLVVALEYVSSKILNTTKRQDAFSKSLEALALMIAAIGVFAISIYALRNVDAGRIWGQAAALIFMLTAITALTLALESFSKNTKFSITKKSWSNIQKTFVMIAEFIAAFVVLAIAFYALSDVDAGRMWGQATALVTALTALSVLAGGLITFSKKTNTNWGDVGKMSAMLAAMVGIFTVLSLVFKYIINDIPDPVGMIAKSQIIMLALYELAGLIAIVGVIANLGAKIAGGEVALIAMVGIFAVLIQVFKVINDLKTEGIMAKSQTIILVLLELEALVAIAGILGGYIPAILLGEVALIAMVGIFAVLVQVFKVIDSLKTEGIMAKSQTIILVLFELETIISICSIFSVLALVGGLGLIAMVGIFAALTQVFKVIDGLHTEGLLPKSQIIVLVLLELETVLSVLSILSVFTLIGGWGLDAMVEIFGKLSQVFVIIDHLHLDGLLDKANVILQVLLKLEGLSLISIFGVFASIGGAGIDAMVNIFGKLATIFLIIQDMKLDGMQERVNIIVNTILELEKLSAIGGLIGGALGNGLLILAEGITMIGNACMMVGVGVTSFSASLINLSIAVDKLTSTGPKITAWFTSIAVGVMTLTTSIMTSITGLSKSVVNAVNTLITGIIAAIINGGALIFAASSKLSSKINEGIKSKFGEITKIPGDIVKSLVNGIKGVAGRIMDAGKSMGKYLVDGFRDATGWHSPPKFLELFFGDASSTIQIEGMNVGKLLGNMGTNWGEMLSNGFGSFDLSNLGFEKVMEIVNGLKSGEGNLMDEIMRLMGMMDKLTAYKNKISSSWAKGTGTMTEYEYSLQTAITGSEKKIKQYNDTLKRGIANSKEGRAEKARLKEEIAKETAELEKNNKALSELYGKEVAATEASNDFTDALGGIGEGGGKAAKGTAEAKDAISDFYNSIESAISLFDKFEEEEGMSSEELLSNMESQIFGIANWSTQLQELATKGIDQGLLKKLADMGPSGQKYVKAFVSMTADQLAHANELYQQSLLLPQHVTAQVFASFEVAGQNATTGFLNGLDHDQVKTQGVQFAHDFLDNFRAAMGIHSPSEETKQDGINTTSGLTKGITWPTAIHNLEVGVTRVVNKVLDTFDNGLNEDKFKDMGMNIVNGIKRGIEDQGTQGSLFSRLRELCNRVVEEAKSPRGFWEHSPSRKFQDIGKFVVEGLAKGISDNTYSATDAIGKSATDVIDEMRDTINKANEALIDEVDDPVIKPVLDLSEIQNGSRTLDDMLSRNSAFSASSSFRNLQNQQWGNQSALLNATMDNSDVVGAIDSLKTDINSLKETMTNIRMVLDTGTMVGAMTPMIDEALGKRMVYAGRGI